MREAHDSMTNDDWKITFSGFFLRAAAGTSTISPSFLFDVSISPGIRKSLDYAMKYENVYL